MAEDTGSVSAKVRLGVCINLPSLLSSLGHDPKPVLRRSGFQLEQFSDPDLKVSYRQLSELLEESVRVTECDHLGLLLGQSATPSHLGIAGFLLRFAPDVGSALSAMADCFAFHDEGGTPILSIHQDVTLLGYSVKHPEVMAIEQIHDLVTAFAYRLMLELCGPAWRPSEVLLSRRRPVDTKPYKKFFETTVVYDADMSAVAFPSHLLTQPVPSADQLLFQHLKREATHMHQLKHLDLLDALRQHLRQGLLHREWSAADMAQALGIKERTLHRRLHARGTTYRQELDNVRQDFSLLLLGSTSMSLAEVAESLGYAHSSTFTRAFTRWLGTTPSEWRKQNL
jgi:AraC-like DNA-binding protein